MAPRLSLRGTIGSLKIDPKSKMCSKLSPREALPSPRRSVIVLDDVLPAKWQLVTKDNLRVRVGQTFRSRRQLSFNGVHKPYQAGIGTDRAINNSSGAVKRVAISLVSSGKYEDDNDKGEVLHYTASGGNDPRTFAQHQDQHMTGPNRSLANNIHTHIPVRVIRRHSEHKFSYDGLYNVVKVQPRVGKSGYRIYMFTLKRQPNQVPLSSYL